MVLGTDCVSPYRWGDTSHTQKPRACQCHEGTRAKKAEGNQTTDVTSNGSTRETSFSGAQVLGTLSSISEAHFL